MGTHLTARQKQVLDFLGQFHDDHGYPPTLREIGRHMGIKSTNGVNDHLQCLERKGYIERQEGLSRGLRVIGNDTKKEFTDGVVRVKVLGRVAAGLPLYAEENLIDIVTLDDSLVPRGELFGLKVKGDSMCEDGILSGDTIIVRRQNTAETGQTVVVLLGDDATVKKYYPGKQHVRFQPANAKYAPILVRAKDFKPTMILGLVVGLFRKL